MAAVLERRRHSTTAATGFQVLIPNFLIPTSSTASFAPSATSRFFAALSVFEMSDSSIRGSSDETVELRFIRLHNISRDF